MKQLWPAGRQLGMRIVVLAVVVLLAAGVPTAAAVPAKNSSVVNLAGFLAAEHPFDEYWGGPATDQQLTSIGYSICNWHRMGFSDLEVLTRMLGGDSMMSPPGSEAREKGIQRVRNAIRFICP